MKYVFLAIALAASNFTYQWLTDSRDWGIAFERSFFQAIAVFLAAVTA